MGKYIILTTNGEVLKKCDNQIDAEHGAAHFNENRIDKNNWANVVRVVGTPFYTEEKELQYLGKANTKI